MNPEVWMEEALELALRGRGEVEPNPRVGALALHSGAVVGRGWHRVYGGPHAEVEALAAAKSAGHAVDTVVVTLEPCSTPQDVAGKKTPPCVRALLDAGVRRVIVGQRDPDPRHRGRGLIELEQAGVQVEDGVLESRCKAINAPFLRWLQLDRPWTIAKWAMTLCGKTAAVTGESRWISGQESRNATHELRTRVDAVAVGFKTALVDDPELTVRYVPGRQPVRIVIDPLAEIDDDSKLVATALQIPLWLLVGEDVDPARSGHLTDLGVQVIHVPRGEGPRRLQLRAAWRELRRRGIRRLLVEGGGELVAQLFAWDCVDQTLCFLAPKIIGGKFAPTPVGGPGKPFMSEALRLAEMHWHASGPDLAVGAFVLDA